MNVVQKCKKMKIRNVGKIFNYKLHIEIIKILLLFLIMDLKNYKNKIQTKLKEMIK